MIVMLTTNIKKFEEYQTILGLYGAKIRRLEPVEGRKVAEIFQTQEDVEYVLRETSDLFSSTTHQYSSKSCHLESVYNKAELIVYTKSEDGRVQSNRFMHQIDGYIDLEKRIESADVFDWDDIFVVTTTQMSYHEMKRLGLKKSSRDLVLADFFKHYLHYDKRIDLQFNPQNQPETVDFSKSVIDFIQHNPYLNNPHMNDYKLPCALNTIVGQGLFFRSASNRREKNYWSPGLNGGIPLTPKRDDIHEITFMFHDLMHFVMPDLIYGGQTDPLSRSVYIVYRMISEAVTLVLADMLFVDTLVKSGIDYDYNKRRIYPLFQNMSLDFENDFKGALKLLLTANVRYALMGDDTYFQSLLGGKNQEILNNYKEKYERYFIADYQWTGKNFDHMAQRAAVYTNWVNLIGRDTFNAAHLVLLEDFTRDVQCRHLIDHQNLESVVTAVFECMFDSIIWPALTQPTINTEEDALTNAFRRYMIGQTMVFTKYPFVTGAYQMGQKLLKELKKPGAITVERIKQLRDFYNIFVDQLYKHQVISQDDQTVFKQVHPLFDPFYVFYESKTPEFIEIRRSAESVLSFKKAA